MNITNFIKNPFLYLRILEEKILIFLPDKKYIKLLYKNRFKKDLNLNNPETFNEKLQWLKLYDRNPIYTQMVDKYSVKEYVSHRIGSEYVVQLLGVWDNIKEINFDKLPNRFVIKSTHNSGGVIICQDKKNNIYYTKDHKQIKFNDVIKFFNKKTKQNYYYSGREWPYKNVIPRVMIEAYIDGAVQDYKFICCDGEVKCFYIESGRTDKLTCDFYDLNYEKIPVSQVNPNSNILHNIPSNMGKMIEMASILSKDIPQVRVDFMVVENKIYFGEFTFYNWCGFGKFEPYYYDKIFGEWIDLSKAYIYKKD